MSQQHNSNSLIQRDSASTIDAIYHSLAWHLGNKGDADADPGEVFYLQGVLQAVASLRESVPLHK